MIYYVGIGSRETLKEVLKYFEHIGQFLASKGFGLVILLYVIQKMEKGLVELDKQSGWLRRTMFRYLTLVPEKIWKKNFNIIWRGNIVYE